MSEIIRYNRIDDYLMNCYRKKLSVFIHGPPGIGKSAAVVRVTGKLGIEHIDLRLTQMDAVDLRGLPVLSTEGQLTGWAPPEDLPRERAGILFLDELNLAPPSVQHAAYQLILQRRLGKYHLPPDWVCFAAGNRVEDRAHVTELPSPLANRFVHIFMDTPPIEDWLNWGSENGIDERILGFLRWKPDFLFQFNPDNPGMSFPTPRSWEFYSKLIDDVTDAQKIRDYGNMTVGTQPAGELLAFIEIFSQINPEEILTNPEFQFPLDNLAILVATIIVVGSYVKNQDNSKKIQFLKLLTQDSLSAEYTVLGVQLSVDQAELISLLEADKELLKKLSSKIQGFIDWD